MPEGGDPREARTLGLKLVYSIAEEQLRGSVRSSAGPGLEFANDQFSPRA